MPNAQPDLFSQPPPDLPPGLAYRPDVISEDHEADLVARFADLDFRAFEFQGYLGRRRVVYFGWRYDFSRGKVGETEPIPDFILPLREIAATFAGLAPERLEQVLINEYQPGAPIGWHRDRPQFGDVVGVSLLSPARMRFRLKQGDGWKRSALVIAPRSAYLMRGPAREAWEHSIPPALALRYSVTFRTLRDKAGCKLAID